MWIGSWALVGLPPFAGYFSKDIMLEAAYGAHTPVGTFAFWMGIGAAFMTAFYSWRLIIMAFHGKPRANDTVMAHVHESPKIMTMPLVVLALGAIFAGYLGYENFVGHNATEFWNNAILILPIHQALENAHHVPGWVIAAPLVVTVAGIGLAYILYMFAPSIPGKLASTFNGLYKFLLNKWYWDELYDFLFVKPAFYLGRGFWKAGDEELIDGVGPNGFARATKAIAGKASRLQTGYLYHYAFVMLAGVAILVTWYLFTKG